MADRGISKEEITRRLDQLTPENLAEVSQFIDFLQYRSALAATSESQVSASNGHPAFGLWATRSDINDSSEFAVKLRRIIEEL